MSTHAITLAPYLESFDSDTTADNAIINDVTSILEDVIPIMEHPSENFLSDVSALIYSALIGRVPIEKKSRFFLRQSFENLGIFVLNGDALGREFVLSLGFSFPLSPKE